MVITVFGLGFVGLTTALGFAHLGYKVYGIDVDKERTDILKSGRIPFLEPDIEKKLGEHLNTNFYLTDNTSEAICDSDIIFYCVGTPYGKDGNADLTYLFSAIDTTIEAARMDKKYRVMVTKSTIPPSTTVERIKPYIEAKGDIAKQFGIANNPEFLREGHCWQDFMEADRIVIGCEDDHAREMLIELYKPMQIPMKCVSCSTGEFIKYLSNTLLATLISYSNEMAEIADTIGGINVADAFHILHMDKRWNDCNMTSYVYPGCGYGGYCLPKDTCALYSLALEKGMEPRILENVIKTNEDRPKTIAEQICKGLEQKAKIGILGLAFKPLSDDVRDTAAAKIIHELKSKGYQQIYAYDPAAMEEFKKRYPDMDIIYKNSAKEVYDASDVIAIVTAWDEFKKITAFGDKKIIDCRYLLS